MTFGRKLELGMDSINLWRFFVNIDDDLVNNYRWVICNAGRYGEVITYDYGACEVEFSTKYGLDAMQVVSAYVDDNKKILRVYVKGELG